MKTLFNNAIATIKSRFAAVVAYKSRSKRNAEQIEELRLMYESRIDELECRIDELTDGYDQCVQEEHVESIIESAIESAEFAHLVDTDELLQQVDVIDYINVDEPVGKVMNQIDWDRTIAEHDILQAHDDLSDSLDMEDIADQICNKISQRLLSSMS